MRKKVVYEAEYKTGDAEKAANDLGDSIKDAGNQAKKTAKDTESIGDAAKKSDKQVSLLSKGFKGLGTAMKAAGIGIIIGLAAKLTEIFMENQSVVDATNKAFGTLKVVFQQFTEPLFRMVQGIGAAGENFDALIRVGKALLNIVLTPVKLVFKEIQLGVLAAQLAWEKSFFGDDDPETIKNLEAGLTQVKDDIIQIGKDAVESGKTVVNDFGEAFTEAANIATKTGEAIKEGYENVNLEVAQSIAESNVELEKSATLAEARIQGVIEKYDLQAERLRQIRDNETLSIDERIQANEELGRVLQEQQEVQLEQAQKVLDAARVKLSTDKENIEFQRAVIEAENEVAATRAQIAGFESEQQVNANALLKEKQEILKELALIGKSDQERAILEAEQERERQIELIERTVSDEQLKKERLLAVEQEYNNAVNAIEEEAAAKQKAIRDKQQKEQEKQAKEEIKREQMVQNAKLSLVATGLNAIQANLEQGSKASKAVATAQVLFDTYKGIQATFASAAANPSSILFPAQPFIQAAAAAAFGIANLRKIQNAPTASANGSASAALPNAGGATANAGASAPNISSSQINSASDINTDDIIRRQGNAQQEPIPAYVLEGSVTDAQQAQRLINQQATL